MEYIRSCSPTLQVNSVPLSEEALDIVTRLQIVSLLTSDWDVRTLKIFRIELVLVGWVLVLIAVLERNTTT